jgi:uncharacterized glyoxalase superfamily protein PhnB
MTVKPIPEGYHTITPYLAVRGADRFVEFLHQAFGGSELHRVLRADGVIMHSEVKIGDSIVMLTEACEVAPPTSGMIHLYVTDADATYDRALQAGAVSTQEPTDQFYGDRAAGIKDPFGIQWWIATHQEDLSMEDIQQRAEAHSSNEMATDKKVVAIEADRTQQG